MLNIALYCHAVVGKLRYGPVLTTYTLKVTASHEDGVAFRGGRMESPGCYNWTGHSAYPQLAGDAVNSAPVFAKGARTEIIVEIQVFHIV